MNQADFLKKYATANIETGSYYGLLDPKQSHTFIDRMIERSQLLQMVTRRTVAEKSGYFYEIDMANPATVAAIEAREYNTMNPSGGNETANDTGSLEHTRFSYEVKKRRTQFELTWEDLHWTIEQGTYRQHVMNIWNKRTQLDTEILAIQGDEDLYGGPSSAYELLVDINEGWLQQISVANGAHILDASNLDVAYVTPDMYASALNLMPAKYLLFGHQNFRWLTSPHVIQDYRHYLMSRQTNLGDVILQSQKNLTPEGFDILGINQIPENLNSSGVVDTSSPGTKCNLILMDPAALWWIVHRDMSMESKRVQEKDSWRYTGYMADDFIVTNHDAIVRVINISRNTDWAVDEES